MSQETQIGNLGSGINDEDSKLVDSILNDLNNHNRNEEINKNQEPAAPRQEMNPEQMRQIQMQRQMAMQQQQLMQQQQMAMAQQQMAQQQIDSNKMQGKEMKSGDNNNFIEQIKNESKSIILVVLLSIIMNLEQVDTLFKSHPSLFLSDNGSLNIQSITIKAILIGGIFYAVKTYLF